MITPQLEKLILCGKAFFKTFVAGGTKHTLTFGNDRYIIITDITYFPMNVISDNTDANHNTQVAIYGERGYNHFIFRNFNNTNVNNPGIHGFCSPTTINTFILHEQQVGFSFGNAPYLDAVFTGVANTENPSYKTPLDYGKDGDIAPVPVVLNATVVGSTPLDNNFTTRPASGLNESQQLFFPMDSANTFLNNIRRNFEYPLLHVNYVEVLGQPGNIQI
jgi:hypothetical protein